MHLLHSIRTLNRTNLFLLTAVAGVVLLLFFLPACNKDKTPTSSDGSGNGTSSCDDIQNVKKYFAFKEGSWWVYEEENSGARDSVYITEYSNNSSNYDFDVRMYSTYQGYYYHFWPIFATGGQNCTENGTICSKCLRIKRSKYKPGDFVHEQECFFYIAKIGDYGTISNTAYPNDRIIVKEISDNYLLNDSLFGKTYKIHELNTFMEGKQPTNHYFSKGVGLIRKELLDSNQIWNLVAYNVIL